MGLQVNTVQALLPEGHDNEYDPHENIISNEAPVITNKQWDLITTGTDERSYMDPVVFMVNGTRHYQDALTQGAFMPDTKVGVSIPKMAHGRSYYTRNGITPNQTAQEQKSNAWDKGMSSTIKGKSRRLNWGLPYSVDPNAPTGRN